MSRPDPKPMSADLITVLTESRTLGLLGPGPVGAHIEHAEAFADGVATPTAVADLGSGGGVPALVLAAQCWPEASFTLIDAGKRRCAFLTDAVHDLGFDDRVQVRWQRAEEAGRDPALRGAFGVVTARGFGPPAVTAECGAPLLRVGGLLVVSEPPGGEPGRWPADGLGILGLVGVEVERSTSEPAVAHFEQVSACPERYPRRVGIPTKRPLFTTT